MNRAPAPVARRRRPTSDAGFNLVVLVMAVTVLNVLATMALPAWSHQIQREREAELIFRGLQYAEAIRVFQTRNGRFPMNLRELVEVNPRSIRQLWKNPMTEDGSWLLLPAAAGRNLNQGQNPNQDPRQNPGRRGNAGNQQPARGRRPTAVRVVPDEKSLQPVSMAFLGVASPEGEKAVKTFMGSNEIMEWRFTLDLVQAKTQSPAEPGLARPVHAGTFWKPFPPGITPQVQLQQPPRAQVGGDPRLRPQRGRQQLQQRRQQLQQQQQRRQPQGQPRRQE